MISKVAKVVRSQVRAPKLLLDLPYIYDVEITKIEKSQDKTVIRFRAIGKDNYIILDTVGNQIIWGPGAYADLTGHNHLGIDSLDILLLGAPAIAASAPLLAINSLVWKASKKLFGMSRHILSIWCRIRAQLDPDTETKLFNLLIQL